MLYCLYLYAYYYFHKLYNYFPELRSGEISEHLADYLADYHSKVMPFGKTAGKT